MTLQPMVPVWLALPRRQGDRDVQNPWPWGSWLWPWTPRDGTTPIDVGDRAGVVGAEVMIADHTAADTLGAMGTSTEPPLLTHFIGWCHTAASPPRSFRNTPRPRRSPARRRRGRPLCPRSAGGRPLTAGVCVGNRRTSDWWRTRRGEQRPARHRPWGEI